MTAPLLERVAERTKGLSATLSEDLGPYRAKARYEVRQATYPEVREACAELGFRASGRTDAEHRLTRELERRWRTA